MMRRRCILRTLLKLSDHQATRGKLAPVPDWISSKRFTAPRTSLFGVLSPTNSEARVFRRPTIFSKRFTGTGRLRD